MSGIFAPIRPLRGLSVRTLGFALSVGIGLYVAGFVVYVALAFNAAARSLSARSADTPTLFGEMADRARALDAAVAASHRMLPADPGARVALARALRDTLLGLGDGVRSDRFAAVPRVMRVALSGADDRAAQLQTALLEAAALVELGRFTQVPARLGTADSLGLELERLLAVAQRHEVQDLASRERALAAAADRVVGAVAWWLVIGACLLGGAAVLLWRRLGQPLEALHDGLTRVSGGDLGTRLAVDRSDEMGQLAEHFNRMTGVLQSRAEAQGQFVAAGELIAGVAHEVNNPLMAIAALAENRLADARLPEEARDEVTLILRQARRAAKLVSGLLRFLRPVDDRAAAVDVNHVVRASLELVSYRFPVDEITLDLVLAPDLPLVRGQAARLEQVFVNLIANAADALVTIPAPRRLRVWSQRRGSDVVVSVEDNGPGITPAIAERLFHPFATSKGHGTGLGLYISREIVRAAGGDVTVCDDVRAGACFMVTLRAEAAARPASPEPATAGAAVAPAPRSLEGVEVLLVDDEAVVRQPLARFLRRMGALVIEARDGVEAAELLESHQPDVVVADLRMPRLDGPGLYVLIRERRPALAARVLILSGDLSRFGELAHSELADRFVAKPVELAELASRIAGVIQAEADVMIGTGSSV